ncbi:MAG: AAA family ATPase [Planctomycetaceae bacterium]|nr:AAA family ATPase [Planctomycetaceae bacterium]
MFPILRSIAVFNQKGGVGKTTTSVNVCAALTANGAKVMLIDLDPQAHATLHFGIEPRAEFDSVYDVLTGNRKIADVRKQITDNLYLVPSHLDLSAADVELAGIIGREMILRDKLEKDDLKFDYLFIDCPPTLGLLTINALTAVEEVFIPIQPHYLALHGLSKLLETVDLVSRRLNPRLRVSGVMFCMYDGQTSLAKEVTEDVGAFFQKENTRPAWADVRIFQTRVRRNIKLAEAPSFGQSIFDYEPASNGADDYKLLAEEIAGM